MAFAPGQLSARESQDNPPQDIAPGVAAAAAPGNAGDGKELAKTVNDPPAPLMAYQLINYYSPALHNSDEPRNMAQFRAAVPFELFGSDSIARLSLPYFT